MSGVGIALVVFPPLALAIVGAWRALSLRRSKLSALAARLSLAESSQSEGARR